MRWPHFVFAVSFIGCSQSSELPSYPTVQIEGDASAIFFSLLADIYPPERYLTPSQESREYILLCGKYNNGAKEQCILIERQDDTVRLRAWWYGRTGDVWCIDIALSDARLDELWSVLETNEAFDLPNLYPDVSHGMTYLLQIQRGEEFHESLGYHVDDVASPEMFGPDQKMASNWSIIVANVLALRKINEEALTPTEFDENGCVKWGAPVSSDVDRSRAFAR